MTVDKENEIIHTQENYIFELENKLSLIQKLVNAYPVKNFPEPNLDDVHKALKDNGLSLGAVTASNFRRVLKTVQYVLNGEK